VEELNVTEYKYYTGTSIKATAGLVAAYNMVPNGTTLVDISGNGNNGTINGALSIMDGLNFDGVNDKVTITNTTIKDIGKSNFTYIGRFKANTISSEDYIMGIGSIGLADAVGITITSGGVIRSRPFAVATTSTSEAYDDGKWHTFCHVIDRDGDAVLYIDTVPVLTQSISAQAATALNTGSWYLGVENNTTAYFSGEISDARIYNRVLTQAEITAYHNSFIKPVIVEDFSDQPASGENLVPTGWQQISGTTKIGEVDIVKGALTTNFIDSPLTITEVTATGFTQAYTGGSGSKHIACGFPAYAGTVGKRYTSKFTLTINSGAVSSPIKISGMGTTSQDITAGANTFNVTSSNGINGTYFSINSTTDCNYTISNFILTEIDPSPTVKQGTKYIENVTAGVLAIPSNIAYGTWEFDWYKGVDVNNTYISFINNTNSLYTSTYTCMVSSSEYVGLLKNGSGSGMSTSPNSYITNNTWYRTKIARLSSAGVFKDIPTLQTGSMAEDAGYVFSSFTSLGKNGYIGVKTVVDGTAIAATPDEISIVNNAKYLIECDLDLYSGVAPSARFAEVPSAGTKSNVQSLVQGRNSFILTATGTDTCVLAFYTGAGLSNHRITGLTIRRIYDASTFAVFIKGGRFGDDYTLVDVTGGSGTNPVTDATFSTSNYFVLDLDAGDRFTNLIITDGIKQ